MTITILTLFPEMFTGPLDHSIIGRARKNNTLNINLMNIRDFATDAYGTVDDHPYGGGVGMIMKVDVIDAALTKAKQTTEKSTSVKTILLDPAGTTYNQEIARKYAQLNHLIIICGHYEGVDERVFELVDEVISIGDYVLTGGELAAMAIVDSVARLTPGVLGNDQSAINESFSTDLIEAAQYTRPALYKGLQVPDVLLKGNHEHIRAWRQQSAKVRTQNKKSQVK